MAYEIDFIGVSKEKSAKDADAICLRWKDGTDRFGNELYKIGVIDGGFEAHGDALVKHMNEYYFDDKNNEKSTCNKVVDFMIITHADQDHTIGIKKVLENFSIRKIYMNMPWLYSDDLFDKISDGRITKESLKRRLREKYKTIANIEDIANEQGITIYPAFQGAYVEDKLLILSPSKQFYLDLLVESEKTPLEESEAFSKDEIFGIIAKYIKEYVLDLMESWDVETLREDVKTSAENETSVVIRGLIDESGFLLTGDAGIRALTEALNYMELLGEDCMTEVSFYQLPHHGSRHNVSPSILDRMLGEKVKNNETRNKTAYASVAKDSDHPLKMVTNAYIRRGVKTYKTNGNVIRHHVGNMPKRNWASINKIEFSDYVEGWED